MCPFAMTVYMSFCHESRYVLLFSWYILFALKCLFWPNRICPFYPDNICLFTVTSRLSHLHWLSFLHWQWNPIYPDRELFSFLCRHKMVVPLILTGASLLSLFFFCHDRKVVPFTIDRKISFALIEMSLLSWQKGCTFTTTEISLFYEKDCPFWYDRKVVPFTMTERLSLCHDRNVLFFWQKGCSFYHNRNVSFAMTEMSFWYDRKVVPFTMTEMFLLLWQKCPFWYDRKVVPFTMRERLLLLP